MVNRFQSFICYLISILRLIKFQIFEFDFVYFLDGLSKCLDSILSKGTSVTFAFPETAFTTVTAYQNQQVPHHILHS